MTVSVKKVLFYDLFFFKFLKNLIRLPEFTHGGKWRVISDHRDESQGKTQEIHWAVEHVTGQIDLFNQVII
jgi:hypothetical protein